MKTILKVLTLIFCSLFLLLSIFSIFNICTQKYKLEYETWFDTKNVFGNGEYQQYSNGEGGLDLYNIKYNCGIIDSVVNYVEQDEKVYIKGYIYDYVKKKTFEVLSILDLETNMLKYCVVDGKFEEYYITISSFMGIAIVALPTGIITAGYMNELNKREKENDK